MGEERDSHGIDAGGCKTPRTGVASGSGDRFTPNGTKVPSGSPPKDQHSEILEPPPPVPPLPMEAHEDVSTVWISTVWIGMKFLNKLQMDGF